MGSLQPARFAFLPNPPSTLLGEPTLRSPLDQRPQTADRRALDGAGLDDTDPLVDNRLPHRGLQSPDQLERDVAFGTGDRFGQVEGISLARVRAVTTTICFSCCCSSCS